MMNGSSAPLDSFLICRSGLRFCGFPLQHVAETMRVLPLEPFPEMPSFVLGVSIVRGVAVPVVNLALLLGVTESCQLTRYVTLNLGARQVAFAVEAVIGVRHLGVDMINDLPPLLSQTESGVVAAITTLDTELLLVLNGMRFFHENDLESVCAQAIHS
jgi:purine-binding chemotaxis protein CheW